ncbi:MAG: hypothetical protein KR126chlam6_00164 [Candidatus Anoxychlamydiales bacterium]|nr:hypothetical protein [Candidatus Anoxychlamydiales bacterium]
MKIEVSDVNFTGIVSEKGANPWVGKLKLSANADRAEDKEYFIIILKGILNGGVYLTDTPPTPKDLTNSSLGVKVEYIKKDKVKPSKELRTQLSKISTAIKVDDIAGPNITLINQFVCDTLNKRLSKVEKIDPAKLSAAVQPDADAKPSAEAPDAKKLSTAGNDKTLSASRFNCGNEATCIAGLAFVILGMVLSVYFENN